MTFVTSDSSRAQLKRLTLLLVSAFPGSTIYQHPDLLRVPHDALNNKVDAVVLEADPEKTESLDMMQLLHRQKPTLPVFIISKTDHLYQRAIEAGASGYFVFPNGEQQFLDALRAAKADGMHPRDF